MEWQLPYGSQRRNGLLSCGGVRIELQRLRRWVGIPNQRVVEGSRDAKALGNVHVCESQRDRRESTTLNLCIRVAGVGRMRLIVVADSGINRTGKAYG
jgi:hypothetical protein